MNSFISPYYTGISCIQNLAHLAYYKWHVSSGIWPIWHITLACVILHVTGMSQFCSSGKTGVRGRYVALENTNAITCHVIFLSYSTMSSDLIMILSYEMSHLFLRVETFHPDPPILFLTHEPKNLRKIGKIMRVMRIQGKA